MGIALRCDCVTRRKMWLAEAFEVPNAMVNDVDVEHEKGYGLLPIDLSMWSSSILAAAERRRRLGLHIQSSFALEKDLYEIVHELGGGGSWRQTMRRGPVYEMADRPGARSGTQILGTWIRPMAWPEIRSTSAPTAWRRSFLSVCLQLVRGVSASSFR